MYKQTYPTKYFPNGQRYIDYTGSISHGITFLSITNIKKSNGWVWNVRCTCGKVFQAHAGSIRANSIKSCGCARKHRRISISQPKGHKNKCFKDYTGTVYNGLKFISVAEQVSHTYKWTIQCRCGKCFKQYAYQIFNNKTISCGCTKKPKQPKIKDYTNLKYHKLQVIDIAYFDFNSISHWLCLCKCGKYCIKSQKQLSKKRSSCGCTKSTFKNWAGTNLNRWTVLNKYKIHKYKYGSQTILWKCRCICGQERWISKETIRVGKNQGCGCHKPSKEEQKQIYKEKAKAKYKENRKNETPEQRRVRLSKYKEWYYNNQDRILTKLKEKYDTDPIYKEKIMAFFKTPKGRELKRKRENRPQSKIHKRLNSRIRSALKQVKVHKHNRTHELTGCSIDVLKQHFESLFQDGMSWENMDQWHIDHIRPCASFDLTNLEEQKQCFHYTNLQPLWAKDNIKKGSLWKGKKHKYKCTSNAK